MTQLIIPQASDTSCTPTRLPPPYTWSSTFVKQPTSPTSLTTTTTLLIGPSLTQFHIHTTLLLTSSPYFRACLQGPFLESTTNQISLPDMSPSIFSLVATWLYTRGIPAPHKDGKPAYYTLLHLYAAADRLCIEGLRNCVVDTVCRVAEETNSVPTPSDTRLLYSEVRASAPLRDLVLDLFAYMRTGRLVGGHEDEWDAEFLRDLVVRLKTPSERGLRRHGLGVWWCGGWEEARACEGCGVVLGPRRGTVRCGECGVVFCGPCVEGGVGRVGGQEGRRKERGACRPWRGARCSFYHEHEETERCGDVFAERGGG